MKFDFTQSGKDNLLKAMKNLPKSMRNKVIRSSLRAGGKIVQKKAISNVQAVTSGESSGLLAKSIVVRSKKTRGKVLGVVVAINKAVSAKGARVGLYGSVLEHGKENQPPRPWLRPAADQSSGEAISAIVTEARSRLNDAVADAKRGS